MKRVVVIGSGVGGLVSAAELAHRGLQVTVLERSAQPGGKIRWIDLGSGPIDVGPTVLTMRWVLELIYADLGQRVKEHLQLLPCPLIARHAWSDGTRLDLFSDPDANAEEIARVFGRSEASAYRRFCSLSSSLYRAGEASVLLSRRPLLFWFVARLGMRGLSRLWQSGGTGTMWDCLTTLFTEPKLRQLFARYATYYGCSPFAAPATLNLIAHAERAGVWLVEGGMRQLAVSLAELAERSGATICCSTEVSEIVVHKGKAVGVRLENGRMLPADAVVCNADSQALAAGGFGSELRRVVQPPTERSLSAFTIAMEARATHFELAPHNVFFSDDYGREFADLANGRAPGQPTVYVRAQDRDDASNRVERPERLFCVVNAPATGDNHTWTEEEETACLNRAMNQMARCGLELEPVAGRILKTTPRHFALAFPHTGGALYGAATHEWRAPLRRPRARTSMTGLYLAGGSVHPGAGVPMVALSGRLAANAILEDWGLLTLCPPTATAGGTLTA